MLLPITSLFAALLTLLLLVLSFRIIAIRRRERIGIGIGESKPLAVAVRIHGNFTEFVPMAVILLAFMEFANASAMMLYICGSVLFLARISHAIGLSKSVGTSAYRAFGVLGTFGVLLFQAAYLIGSFFGNLL
ncbi:MAG TPA: MAPEG family protein [Aliidiomarina sp.]|nr:MAPEG family protein [Aliidiomarina sp.]